MVAELAPKDCRSPIIALICTVVRPEPEEVEDVWEVAEVEEVGVAAGELLLSEARVCGPTVPTCAIPCAFW